MTKIIKLTMLVIVQKAVILRTQDDDGLADIGFQDSVPDVFCWLGIKPISRLVIYRINYCDCWKLDCGDVKGLFSILSHYA